MWHTKLASVIVGIMLILMTLVSSLQDILCIFITLDSVEFLLVFCIYVCVCGVF